MLRHKPLWTVVGFLLMASGFLALILSMVGLEWQPLQFIYGFGGLAALIIQLCFIVFGFALLFVARNPEQ
ncbi:MAG: hypothetical protein WAT79_07355 [Saprospiraceae bacterium]